MTHKIRHKQLDRIKRKYKNLAGIVAAATIFSTAMLPGMPSIAHASASSNAMNTSATTSQQMGKTNQSATQINFNSTTSPVSSPNVNKTPASTIKPTQELNKTTTNVKPDPNANKTPVATPKATEETNKTDTNAQSDPNANKTPIATPKPTEEINQTDTNAQPDPNANNTPVATPKPTEETNKTDTNAQPDPNANNTPVATPKPTEETNKTDTNAQPDPNANNTSTNAPTNYKHVLDISATAYAPGPHDNDQWGNKTYIGSQVRPGIIAVDPKVIPLGSRVYIEYPDGHGEYAVAEDTGGAIKGNRVDVAKWTVNEAEKFGIQKVKVYVLETPKNI